MNDMHPSLHGLLHALVGLVVFAAPLVLQVLPSQWADLTLSGAILWLLHWLEYRYLAPPKAQ